MDASEIAAYIGAAAWLPPVLYALYKILKHTKLKLYPGGSVQLGFTELGPIFNPHIAFEAREGDVVVVRIIVNIDAPNGRKIEFRCVNIEETLNEVIKIGDSKQVVVLDKPFLALIVTPNAIVEKMVKCQSSEFHQELEPLESRFETYLESQRNKKELQQERDYYREALESQERKEIDELYNTCFPWYPGKYTAKFVCSTSKRTTFEAPLCEFEISEAIHNQLKMNLASVGKYWNLRSIRNVTPGKSVPIDQPRWVWTNVRIRNIP